MQVLINLLKNSLAAIDTQGKIELGAQQLECNLVVWIKDNGIGISTEQQNNMFDPFVTNKKQGTGLGLAVSHQIVEQHHAYFSVLSEHDKGCLIEIVFPNKGEKNE